MATITIEGRRVTVDDSFLKMSPADQNAAVDEIGSSIGMSAASAAPAGDRATGMAAERNGLAEMGFGEAALRSVPQGFLGNMADEATAAAAASPLPGAGKMRTSGAPNFGPLDVGAGLVRQGAEYLFPGTFGKEGGRLYESKLQDERAQDKRAMTDQPVASIGGNVLGSVANPLVRALPTAGFTTGMKTGAAVGGVYGAGQGEGVGDRAYQGALGSGVGALVGGPLGGLVGRGGAPKAPNEVVAAGARRNVDVPRFVASDKTWVHRTAAAERNVPILGDRLVNAFDKMKGQIGQAADDTAGGLGASVPETAGTSAKDAVLNYVGPHLKAVSKKAYRTVDNLVAPNAALTSPLSETQSVVSNILARNVASARPNNGAAVDAVKQAVMRKGGMTYEGIKDLRSRVGLSVDDFITQGMDKKEYGKLYGALTQDLRESVRASGGPQAVPAFDKANLIHKMGMDRKEALEKIVGSKGQGTGEQVFSRLMTMAGSKSSADVQALMQARKAMGPDAWNEVAGTVVSRLGRDTKGEFSPDRFITAWGTKNSPNGLSDRGKDLLFVQSSAHRKALDDITTLSLAAQRQNKFANPSGTAQTSAGIALLTGAGAVPAAFAAPLTTATVVLGNMAISRILSAPATAVSMARWSRAHAMLIAKPAAGTMAAFQQASKNFAATIGDKLGLNVNPMEFVRAIAGAKPSRAEGDQAE